MRRKPLLWHLYPSYLVITLVALIAVSWYALSTFRGFYLTQNMGKLEVTGKLVADRFLPLLAEGRTGMVDSLCKKLGARSDIRFTVILPDGRVIGDSRENPDSMDNHAYRPEFVEAIASGEGTALRFSHTLEEKMLYVAVPLRDADTLLGVLRMAVPNLAMETTFGSVSFRIAIGALLVAILAVLASLYTSRRISRPLDEMRRGAERFAAGELLHKVAAGKSQEMRGLADALNQMAAQLYDRMQTVVRQRNEQEAVLTSMIEGVLAVDTDERVITMNRAAADLLGVVREQMHGRTLPEVVRNPPLLEFVARMLKDHAPAEDEITLHVRGERFLQVSGTILRDGQGTDFGVLIVLNDITRIRRLEGVRREFVANVSHELKTPVTSIKGFLETLLDGALDDPAQARRFVEIAARQADRLQAIIEDLLVLSQLEYEEEQPTMPLEEGNLRGALEAAAHTCEPKASAKKIAITLDCPPELTLAMNAPLLEQAIINLIDNAVKYSESGETVVVTARTETEQVVVEVTDHGCGIAEEHLPRLFERFYRVDKARSRTLGGTGLGLSIIKHIAQIHGGYPTVESTPGKGSVFSICLPRRR
jgi:two-component system phosphate regulon sensor histidine kinase PhoR